MTLKLENIPREVDEALQRKAHAEGKSVHQVAVEALRAGLGVSEPPTGTKKRDVSDIAGTWVEDPEFDRAIAEHDQVNPDDWR